MHSDEIYKFIGYTVVVIFAIYVVSKSVSFQTGMIVEGLANRRSSAEITADNDAKKRRIENLKLSNDNWSESIEDEQKALELSDAELKGEYQRRLDNIYDKTNLEFVKMVSNSADTIIGNPTSQASINIMTNANTIRMFLDNLEYVSGALDTIASGNSGGSSSSGSMSGNVM